MDVAALLAQLQQVTKLNEELRNEITSIRSDHEALLDATRKVVQDRDRLQQRIEELEAVNKRLTGMLWGRRSERRVESPGQFKLLFAEEADGTHAEETGVVVAGETSQEDLDLELLRRQEARRKHRREKQRSEEFPAHLERREKTLDLDESEKVGLKYIGDAVTERMRFEKPGVYIERIIRRKYVVENQPERGVIARSAPLAIVEGCKYDFSVIAAMIALKYAFHQPTYRQQDWFAQCGWFPSRSTINDMFNLSVPTVEPLFNQQWTMLLRQPIVLSDETRVLLLTRGALTAEQISQLMQRQKRRGAIDADDPPEIRSGGSVTSYAWLFAGLDEGAPYNVFHWSLTRQQTTIDTLLARFRGVVVGDAYDAYAHIAQRTAGRIQHASCNSHARREFTLAETYQPILCAQILSLYKQLYDIEERGKLLSLEARQQLRDTEARAIWKRMDEWRRSDPVMRAAIPRTPFGKALGYLANQWTALQKYLDDPRLPIDNNHAEQTIRPLTVGRRNWLFLGHPAAAPGRMRLLSVVSSAHRHNLIVEDYLADVLEKLADARQHHPEDLVLDSPYLLDLLPDRWAATHPQSVRHERIHEKQDRADEKRARRACRRLAGHT